MDSISSSDKKESLIENSTVELTDSKVDRVNKNSTSSNAADAKKTITKTAESKANVTNSSTESNIKREVSSFESTSAACAYILASMLMTLLNKQIISKVKFPGTNFLLFCECVISTIFVGQGLYRTKQRRPIQVFAYDNIKYLAACTICKACNMYFSFLSMKYTSLPVYNVLKRLNPISGLCIDYLIRKKSYPLQARIGMMCLFFGAIVTGSGDLDFDIIGYSCAIAAVVGQSSYLVLSARALDNLGPEITHVEVLFYTGFYNQILFFPLMLPELSTVNDFYQTTDLSNYYLFFVFWLYVAQGIILNYITFWCTSVTSPVTTGVCGSAKAVLTSLVGVVIFSANLSPIGWVGFCLNSFGGLLYALSKSGGKDKSIIKGIKLEDSEKEGKKTK